MKLFITFSLTLLCNIMLSGQTLEIHQLNVGQADAAVIFVKKDDAVLKTVVIDGGKWYTKYRDQIRAFLNFHKVNRIDIMINSHYDGDHVGGLKLLLRDTSKMIPNLSVSKVYDRGNKYVTRAFTSNTTVQFRALAGYGNRQHAKVEPGEIIKLYNDPNGTHHINMICVASAGEVIKADGALDDRITTNNPDENDLSTAFLIEYGKFRYFTGGDIGGHHGSVAGCDDSYSCNFTDIESGVADYINHVCVFKVNHHGSRCSTSKYFLNKINATVAINSSGKQNTYKHPRKEVVDLLNNQPGLIKYFLTAESNFYNRSIAPKGLLVGGTVSLVVHKINSGKDITIESNFNVNGENFTCNILHN